MVSLQKRLANRSNSLRSTGPRSSSGKAAAALNAVKGGLFCRALVVPAAGETAEEFEAFTGAVVVDLEPEGVVEAELATRVAGVLWRLRRVVRHEAAAMAQVRVKLPAHPDEVTIGSVELGIPLPPGASTALRLAYVRARIHRGQPGGERYRVAAQVLADLATHPSDERLTCSNELFTGVWAALGRPFDLVGHRAFAAKHGLEEPLEWTVMTARALIAAVGAEAGLDSAAVTSAAREALGTRAAEGDARREQLLAEERDLSQKLLAERDRVALVAALADEKLLARVARAEAHLSRELDRVLVQLERVRGLRTRETTTVVAAVTRTTVGGFVLQSRGGECEHLDPPRGAVNPERAAEQCDSLG